jgi:hypothetical protein
MGPTPRSNKDLGLVTPKARRLSVGSCAVTSKKPCVGKAGGAAQILSGFTTNANLVSNLHGLASNLHEERGEAGGAAQIL